MVPDDLPPAEPLGLGCEDVILVHHVQHGCLQQPGVGGDVAEAAGEHGQDRVLPAAKPDVLLGPANHREPAQITGKNLLEHQSKNQVGHGNEQDRQGHHQIIPDGPLLYRRQDPQQQSHRHTQQHLLDAQAGGDGPFLLDDGLDGLALVDDGVTEIAVEQAGHGGDIPLHDGPIQAVLRVQPLRYRVRQLFHPGGQRVARRGRQQEEGGRRNDKQRQHHDQQTADEINCHFHSLEPPYEVDNA